MMIQGGVRLAPKNSPFGGFLSPIQATILSLGGRRDIRGVLGLARRQTNRHSGIPKSLHVARTYNKRVQSDISQHEPVLVL